MKKIMAILGILCLTVGGGLILGGFAANDWKGFEPTYEAKVYRSTPTGLNGVELLAETMPVSLETGEDETLTVEYSVDECVGISILEENGVLKIAEHGEKRPWFQWVYEFAKRPVMRIVLPKSADAISLNLKSYASDLTVSGAFGSAEIESSTGDVNVMNASFATLFVKTATGNVWLNGITADDISAETATGNLDLSQVKTDNFIGSSHTGNLSVMTMTAQNFTFDGDAGNANLSGIDAVKTKIALKTGNVRGTFVGKSSKYTILLSSITGTASPSNRVGDGEKEVSVETSTGNIAIIFSGD